MNGRKLLGSGKIIKLIAPFQANIPNFMIKDYVPPLVLSSRRDELQFAINIV